MLIRGCATAAHKTLRRWGHAGHIAAEVLFGIVMLAVALGAVLGWRLSRGPVQIGWLVRPIEAALTTPQGARISVEHVALAWEGWRNGVDQPLDLRLIGVRALAADGSVLASLPRAAVSLSPAWLLLGRLVPRAIELDAPQLRLVRDLDGGIGFEPNDEPGTSAQNQPGIALGEVLADLARPPQRDRSTRQRLLAPLAQLRRVLIDGGAISVHDQRSGLVWTVPRARIDLRRDGSGAVTGQVAATLALGPQTVPVDLSVNLSPGGDGRVSVDLGTVSPAALAALAPPLAPLGALAAPVGLTGDAAFTAGLTLGAWHAHARIGAGSAHIGTGDVPVRRAVLELSGADAHALAADLTVTLPGTGGDPHLHLHGDVAGLDGGIDAIVAVELDHANIVDLPVLWPPGIDHGVRDWLRDNLAVGIVHDGHFRFHLTAPMDFSDATLTEASGQLQGEELSVTWLKPLPPIEKMAATLSFVGPDVIDIAGHGGHLGTLQLRGGDVHITGIAGHDQAGVITADIAGPIADVLTLLKHPRLHLLDRRPLPLRDPAGSVNGLLRVTLPFEQRLSFEQIGISATAGLHGAHFAQVVAGRDLDDGEAQLAIDTQEMSAHGTARLGGIPVDLRVGMDFRDGAGGQVIQHAEITGRADEKQLAAARLDTLGVLHGPAEITAGWQQHRNGAAEVRVHADAAAASLEVAPLGWAKPAGQPAAIDALLRFAHDRLTLIDQIEAKGAGLALRARARARDGRLDRLEIEQARLGQTDMHGTVGFAAGADAPVSITLAGPLLDLSARLSRQSRPASPPDVAPGPAWTADLHFDRALFARGRPVEGLEAHAESDGQVVRRARLVTGGASGLALEITSTDKGRLLSGSTADAGTLLRNFDVFDDMQGGQLTLAGHYDDAAPGHPLIGEATIEQFRVIHTPGLARLLQAMTLYGLADTLAGPGLGFTRLRAPFRLGDDRLELTDARAFSPSIGLTAHGMVDLARQTGSIQGTIVPAYFFNSLLGGLPLVGKLFAPEQGGGLFAATYRVEGPMSDPTVTVNPLAALTPGFLRFIFGGL